MILATAFGSPDFRRCAARRGAALLGLFGLLLSGLVFDARPSRAAEETLASLDARLDQARALYASDAVRAREIVGDAFLAFESSGLDRKLAVRDPAAQFKDWLA